MQHQSPIKNNINQSINCPLTVLYRNSTPRRLVVLSGRVPKRTKVFHLPISVLDWLVLLHPSSETDKIQRYWQIPHPVSPAIQSFFVVVVVFSSSTRVINRR